MTSWDRSGVVRYVAQVADKRGWEVNPDPAFVGPVLEGLTAQAARWGKPFCPCRDVDGGEADRDIVCPCAYAQADVEEHGHCYCGLFLRPGKPSEEVASIPERRPSSSD